MINTSTIPTSEYTKNLIHHDGDTQDIIDVIIEADKKNDIRFCEFAKQFESTKTGLKKLWKFVRYKIKYQTDSFGTQDIKFPAALWRAKKGDCKSKTLFINQVLKCLGIDYITRFVKFRSNEDYTHVYSIAILNGKRIPLDSVYDYFNKEAPYSKELDFMTQIRTIEGHSKSIGTAEGADLYHQVQEEALHRYEEIQQRKQYVQPEAPINFANVSEGEALLELLIRKLKIIGTMKDEQKATTEKGITLIRNTIKTGKVSGLISDDLQGVAARINYYLSLNNGATGHGYRGKALDFMKRKARGNNSIGSFPDFRCLLSHFYYWEHSGSGTQIDPFIYRETTQGQSVWARQYCSNNFYNQMNSISNGLYYSYGRNTKFRTSLADSGREFNQVINAFMAANPTLISMPNSGMYDIQTEAAYNALVEELKQGMPVLSNWANDLYRADNTRPDGTVGTGLLYNFAPDLSQIAGITLGNFPSVVQTKTVLQRQYIDSCVNFSTISRTIFEDMSENGILFDNGGETPERVLSALLQTYNPNIGLAATTATLIVGILTVILSSAPAIIAACNNGISDAATIDDAGENTANFGSQSPSTMPNMDDFEPLTQTNGGGSGGGNNNNNNNNNNGSKKSSFLLPVGAAALTGRYLYKKYQNKKN